MAWSTRELAGLAGTTVNSIRHYHRLGLLNEPERRYNGYKEYEVPDLVRLLRIRRLVNLGVPLSQIGEVSPSTEITPDTLRDVDAGLAANIEDLQRARADIAAVLRDDAPADAPAGFASVASRLSEADSSIIHIYSQVYDADALADLRDMVETHDDAIGDELNSLPPDADDATKQRLAEQLAPALAQNLIDYPWLSDPMSRLSNTKRITEQTFVEAVVALYSPVQLDVLARAGVLANEQLRAAHRG
jgi:DNA-binding transcriptional MerR regulator